MTGRPPGPGRNWPSALVAPCRLDGEARKRVSQIHHQLLTVRRTVQDLEGARLESRYQELWERGMRLTSAKGPRMGRHL